MVRKTLDAMARGGMYDQVGGGFLRYSVDERWLVPHFEKMLYDNALLARAYLEGFQATGDPFHQRIATEILDYVLREMTSPEGGFYSATDADSEGEEGKFFVWTPGGDPRRRWATTRTRAASARTTTSPRTGTWRARASPTRRVAARGRGAASAIDPAELEASLAARAARWSTRARLLRVPPGLDDKVLTAWNGLMIRALAEGHRVLGDPRYLAAADARRATSCSRTLRAARRPPAAHLPRGHAPTSPPTWRTTRTWPTRSSTSTRRAAPGRFLREAEALAERMRADFADEAGGFFSTARDHEPLIVRHREGHDGATPSANAVAARALARLSYHLDRADLREEAVAAIRAYGRAIARQPRAFATSLIVVDLLLEGPVELAFVGPPAAGPRGAARARWRRRYLPNRIVGHHDPGAGDADALPLLAGKTPVERPRRALRLPRLRLPAAGDRSRRRRRRARPPPPPKDAATPPRLAAAPLAGAATAGGHRRATRRGSPRPATGYGPLGTTGLACSRVGFGGYRVDDETPSPPRGAAPTRCASGCNLVDTSTNYTDGGSERLVGAVLAELVQRGRARAATR